MNFAEYNVKDANLEEILLALKSLDTVEAVALGGSRSTGASEENSDYDIYVYCAEIPTAETRENLLEKYCSIAEFGNHYWESEDNTVMNNGIPVDIIYREVDRFGRYIDTVIKGARLLTAIQPHFGTISRTARFFLTRQALSQNSEIWRRLIFLKISAVRLSKTTATF
nr:nucleotidyltransferase domain-containing protein [Ruminococcus bromii]